MKNSSQFRPKLPNKVDLQCVMVACGNLVTVCFYLALCLEQLSLLLQSTAVHHCRFRHFYELTHPLVVAGRSVNIYLVNNKLEIQINWFTDNLQEAKLLQIVSTSDTRSTCFKLYTGLVSSTN